MKASFLRYFHAAQSFMRYFNSAICNHLSVSCFVWSLNTGLTVFCTKGKLWHKIFFVFTQSGITLKHLLIFFHYRPDLTARDVQHIIALGARIPDVDDSWTINGAKFHVNFKYGFGMMDCSKMVELAQTWKNVPPQHICHINAVTIQM